MRLTLIQNEAKKHEKAGEMAVENIAKVAHRNVNWLWKGTLAYGKITLFAGDPGIGKSQFLLYLASIMSLGSRFHGENRLCNKDNVLLICNEDNADDTIKPRLMALGANLDNIDYVKGIQSFDASGNEFFSPISIVENIMQLENQIKIRAYKLIIIDPISLYLGSVDDGKNKEIRNVLGMLNALAERHGACIVLNNHFTKPSSNSGKSSAIYRVMGSIGFIGGARMAFAILKDDEEPEKRVISTIKNNLVKEGSGLIYTVESSLVDGIETSRIKFSNETSNKSADDLLNGPTDKSSPKLDDAKTLLLEMLRNGSVPVSEIRKAFEADGLSVNRMYAAKNALKIYENDSFVGRRGKIWSLPPE
jgi:DNA polymerase III delta prime subunit